MKQLLTAAAVASIVPAPILATPVDAFTLGALFGSAAIGAALIGSRVFVGAGAADKPRGAAAHAVPLRVSAINPRHHH
jgi:hypothetical protein